MKKYFLALGLCTILAACAERTTEVTVRGVDGDDGHSLVSQYVESSEDLACETGGTRLDIYLDMDNSLTVSEGDQYQNSLVACNGANGLDGKDGQDGQDGATGAQGPQGLTGPQGEQGVAGPVGPAGPQGPQGEQGLQGLPGASGSSGATITAYSGNSCTLIAGTSTYVKKSGSNYAFYTTSNCSSSSKIAEISQGESYWAGSNVLGVHNGDGLRAITFN